MSSLVSGPNHRCYNAGDTDAERAAPEGADGPRPGKTEPLTRCGDLGHTAAMAVPTGNVTFLLTDIEGSTRNSDASESEMRVALVRHDMLLTRCIREHDGEVLTERGEGDGFFAVFPTASGAVAAALAMQLAIGDEPWPERAPIKVRVALHTGEAGQDHRGPDVNRCARLRRWPTAGRSSYRRPPRHSSVASCRSTPRCRTSASTGCGT